MHVAFGRVRRKSRIVANYTDCADFKDFCLPSVLVRRTGVWVLRSEDANWKVCGTKESGIRVPSYEQKDREHSSLLQKNAKSRESEFPPTEEGMKMDLAPEQYFVYAWRYTDDTVCKLGVSTLRSFYARIKAAKTVTYQDIELLGIEVFGTEAEARTAYRQRLKTFARVADRRAWVHFDAAVRQWLATECMSNPPTLDAFKDAFQNDPARREKEREYQQRRSSQKRTPRKRTAAKPGKKRTEKDRAYEREYARKRRENDPAYKEKQKERQKVWRSKNPDYDKNRYATDPEYAESRKAARRERYANDPEYRALEKQRRREFAQDNPEYREKRRLYMQEYRKRKKAEGE